MEEMLYSPLISPSCHIWESCCNYSHILKPGDGSPHVWWSPGEVQSVLPHAVPSHDPRFFRYAEGIRATQQVTSLQILNELQILEGTLQMRQKINRRKDSFMVRVNECHLSLATKLFQKLKNLLIISLAVGYLLHYLEWRWILAEASPEHTKRCSNAYHRHKRLFF